MMVTTAKIGPGGTASKILIFYSVASTVVWLVASALGAGMGWSMFLGFTVPPALLLAWALWRIV